MDNLVGLAVLGLILWWFYKSWQAGRQPQRLPHRPIAFPPSPLTSRHARNIVVEQHHDRVCAAPRGGMAGRFFLDIGSNGGPVAASPAASRRSSVLSKQCVQTTCTNSSS